MTTISSRPFSTGDVMALVDLINAANDYNRPEENTTVEDTEQFFGDPRLDVEHNTRGWFDQAGTLVACAVLFFNQTDDESEARIQFYVRPEGREAAIEDDLLGWATTRVLEHNREAETDGKKLILRTRFREDDAYRVGLLTRNGFSLERFYLTLERSLSEPIPEPIFPPDFILRHAEPEDADAYVDAFNGSFIDHWNHHHWQREEYDHYTARPTYQPELNLVAIAPDGTLACFCWAMIDASGNERSQRNDGWINLLGTRRGYRGLGLGRALLLAGLQALKNNGADAARLRVDAENLTGATRLYSSVGFEQVFALSFYSRELPTE